ncbi:MAG TPA: hypothetical protein VF502_20020 [Stellaceae bacterium]
MWDAMTIVCCIKASAARRQCFFSLLLMIGCLAQAGQPAQAQIEDGGSVKKQVEAIQREAKRIDAANDGPQPAPWRRLTLELPHWELSGLFEESVPIFLYARFSEGQLVREETYYTRHGKLMLARVEKWWDVDDERNAPQPAIRQDFYIANDRTIKHVVAVGSSRPMTRQGDAVSAAATLAERSRTIAQALLAGIRNGSAMGGLEEFPLAEMPRP